MGYLLHCPSLRITVHILQLVIINNSTPKKDSEKLRFDINQLSFMIFIPPFPVLERIHDNLSK